MRTSRILLLTVLIGFIEAKDDNHKPEGKAILDQYFSRHLKGHPIDVTNPDKYPAQVIAKMNETLKEHDEYQYEAIMMNAEINSMLYNLKRDEFVGKQIEAFFESLDLMLPSADLKSAKEDLKNFHSEDPELAQELINRLTLDLEHKFLYTYDLVKYMIRMSSRWIPLARLAKFIAANAKNS